MIFWRFYGLLRYFVDIMDENDILENIFYNIL
jgi:hypothetical protein